MGPSKRLKALQQEKSDLVARMEALLNSADDDHRDLTADEENDYQELEAQLPALDKRIEREHTFLSFAALLDAGFKDEFGSKALAERIAGTGNGEPLGILNSPCKIAVAKEGSQTADTINGTNIVKMRKRPELVDCGLLRGPRTGSCAMPVRLVIIMGFVRRRAAVTTMLCGAAGSLVTGGGVATATEDAPGHLLAIGGEDGQNRGLSRRRQRSPVSQSVDMPNTNETPPRFSTQELLPVFYEELRRLAARKIQDERPGITIQATALVHEAWLRLRGASQTGGWRGGQHFMAAAAETMRRILIESARKHSALKRGGGRRRVVLEADPPETGIAEQVLALDDALERLHAVDSQKADIVRLRYFGGLSIEETARELGISPRTADRGWAYARAWLLRAMTDDPPTC